MKETREKNGLLRSVSHWIVHFFCCLKTCGSGILLLFICLGHISPLYFFSFTTVFTISFLSTLFGGFNHDPPYFFIINGGGTILGWEGWRCLGDWMTLVRGGRERGSSMRTYGPLYIHLMNSYFCEVILL